MRDRSQIEEVTAALDDVAAEIAAHPFASPQVIAAHALIDAHQGEVAEAINRQLAEQQLPSLDELGRVTASHTFSWWQLHRRHQKLAKAIERLEAR